mgnify:CR=1 FL=1
MRTVAGVVLLAVAGAAVADDAAEQKRLTGYWKPASVKFDGKEQMPDSAQRQLITLVIQGGEYRMYCVSDPAKDLHMRLCTADLTLDPATQTFQLSVKEGQGKADKRHGIYELKGDVLRLCYGPTDRPRPTQFVAAPGSGHFCEEWVREKTPEKR